jgi:hypothetical protein
MNQEELRDRGNRLGIKIKKPTNFINGASSKLKIINSGKYEYLIVYFKKGKDILRIPTGEKIIKGKMTPQLFFEQTVEGYYKKNIKLLDLMNAVDAYIMFEIKKPNPSFKQGECLEFIEKGGRQYINDKIAANETNTVIISKKNKSLIQYIEDYIQYRKDRNTTRNTAKEFTTMLNRLIAFDKDRKKTTYFSDINLVWSDEFERFLLKKNYSSGTIEKTYTILITVLYHYYERKDEFGLDLSDKFTFKNFKRGSKSRNMANPITYEQFVTLFNHKFSEDYLEKTRIRFCLQCSTGVRYGDINRITPEIIKNDIIMLKPKKTERYNITAEIDLNEYSREILKQYNFNTSGLKIENAPYNRNIKEMFKAMQEKYPKMKFGADYGSHNGRDTFISIAVQSGVDFKTILIWTGQSSYSILDRYIKSTDEYKAGQMNKAFSKPS